MLREKKTANHFIGLLLKVYFVQMDSMFFNSEYETRVFVPKIKLLMQDDKEITKSFIVLFISDESHLYK